jgi:hypothetical protein
MYGRLYLFPFGSRDRARLEAAVDRIAPRYPEFVGFRSVTFFMDEGNGVCGAFSEWDTREAAEAATARVASELTELMGEIAGSTDVEQRPLMLPVRLTFEIYEPRTTSP